MGLADYLFSSKKPAAKDLGSGMAANAATDMSLRRQYLDYVSSMNESGKEAMPYAQWASGRK